MRGAAVFGSLLRSAGALGVNLDALAPVLDVARHADDVGPAGAPGWLGPWFKRAAEAHGIPAGVLAALAGVLSGFDTDHVGDYTVGLLALPLHGMEAPERHRIKRRALAARETSAVRALAKHVDEAAGLLADMSTGTLAEGIAAYTLAAAGGDVEAGERLAAAVVGFVTLAMMRDMGAERWAQLGAALGVAA